MDAPAALVRVPTNQLYGWLHDCIRICTGPTIPIRGDTNRGIR